MIRFATWIFLWAVARVFSSPHYVDAFQDGAAAPKDALLSKQEAGLPSIDRNEFQAELDRLESICNQLGMQDEAATTRHWLAPSRRDQQRFYLPEEFQTASQSAEAASWRKQFIRSRQRFAAHLFELATQCAASGDEAEAYRYLWQVMREDPEHAEANRILGPLATALSARPQRRGTSKSDELGGGTAQRWQSRHFELLSRANTDVSQNLATDLERFYAIWTQCFYELWAPPGRLKERMGGGNTAWPQPERMQVVLLADREDYLRTLGLAEANIGVSVGYYSPKAHRSFFYQGDGLQETVFHELTHQLFAESSLFASPIKHARHRSGLSNGTESSSVSVPLTTQDIERSPGAWCFEGVAVYMESLKPAGEGWTLGGVESNRLQTARYRALRDLHWPQWDHFFQSTIANWKEMPDIGLSYSFAAGLTHLFFDLHPDQPAARNGYLQSLAGVYSGQPSFDHLLHLLGANEKEARDAYRRLMAINDQHIEELSSNPHGVQQLVLSRSQLQFWERISQFEDLEWLDISFSNAEFEQVQWLEKLTKLRRLSLEGTRLDGRVLPLVAKLDKLAELDLSQCAIDDSALAALSGHPNLETLWLSQTMVSEQAFETLRTLKNLKKCEVSSTRITPDSWKKFTSAHPQLRAGAEIP